MNFILLCFASTVGFLDAPPSLPPLIPKTDMATKSRGKEKKIASLTFLIKVSSPDTSATTDDTKKVAMVSIATMVAIKWMTTRFYVSYLLLFGFKRQRNNRLVF